MKTELLHFYALALKFLNQIKKIASFLLETILPTRPYKQKNAYFDSNKNRWIIGIENTKGLSKSSIDQLEPLVNSKNQKRIFSPIPFSYFNQSKTNTTKAFLQYKDSEIKNFIWKLKFELSESAVSFFSYLIADELIAHLSDSISFMPLKNPALLIYCPSSSFTFKERPWDQMNELAIQIEHIISPNKPNEIKNELFSNNVFVQICIGAILCSKNGRSQHLGSKEERLLWSKTRYKISPIFKNYIESLNSTSFDNRQVGLHIICIDDIITTGATFKAVNKILSVCGLNNIHNFALSFTELEN